MSDLSVTAASVLDAGNGRKLNGTAGEAVTAGQPVYRRAADGLLWRADADAAATAQAAGIAAHAAAAGQPLAYWVGGDVFIGATTAVATVYAVSNNAGGIMPVADLNTNMYATILGVGKASDTLGLSIYASGAKKP